MSSMFIPECSPGGPELGVPVATVVLGLKPLLIATVFSSFLLPTGVVLFVFSTPALRRRPSFILNVCAVALGLTQGSLTAYVTIRAMLLEPLNPALISVLTAVYIVGPICVETILFLRVVAAYPPRQFTLSVRLAMYGPAVAFKATRAANAAYLLYTVQANPRTPKTILSESAAIWSSPFAKSELFLQLVDDVYVSTVFLLRIHSGAKFNEKQPASKGPYTALSGDSYAARIRTLFWIALSNFVFPVIFDVAQLVLIFRDPDYVEGACIISVNSYVSVLGVLFSTIWAGSSSSSSAARPRDMPPGSSSSSSLRTRHRSHATAHGALVVAGHLPLSRPTRPVVRNVHGALAVPPELALQTKARPSSRADFDSDALSTSAEGEADSADEHRLLSPPVLTKTK
ncbi:hypothetical protein GSI_12156 [Ganoderma sinense ZZ0214-1]|uniref:Uncharacterized protein n=1 Tax=Ganoderma sinense ZZ0214-1 TaxID=1077348 RepID=A0A2G8RY01_9APHY|nr:hypothetical protein GSI_12156 [Ganoderma sinense ZZ0214-1]